MRRLNVTIALMAGLWVVASEPVIAADPSITSESLRDWAFYNNAAWQAIERNDYRKAEERLHSAIKVLQPYERDRRLMARTYIDLAWVLYQEKRYAEAEPLAKWALSVRENDPKVKPEILFQSLKVLATIERALVRYANAETLYARALEVQIKDLGGDHPEVATTLDDLAGFCCEQRKFTDAETLYKRALAIRKTKLPSENPDLAKTCEHYAAMLRQLGREPEAEMFEARARAIRVALAERAARARIEGEARAARTKAGYGRPGRQP